MVEIDATVPAGVAEPVQRILHENCQTLRFKAQGPEKSQARRLTLLPATA